MWKTEKVPWKLENLRWRNLLLQNMLDQVKLPFYSLTLICSRPICASLGCSEGKHHLDVAPNYGNCAVQPFPSEGLVSLPARASAHCTEVKAPAGLVGSKDQSPSACSASSPSPNCCCRHYLDYTVLDLHPCIPHLQEIFSQVSLMQLALPMTPADMVWVPSREVISLPNKILLE